MTPKPMIAQPPLQKATNFILLPLQLFPTKILVHEKLLHEKSRYISFYTQKNIKDNNNNSTS